MLFIGAAAMTKSLRDGGLQLLGLGTLLAFIGIAMLSPLVSKPVASVVGRLFSRRLPGRLGRENAVRNPRRTAATAAALMIGLALISAVTVLGSSLKASVAKTVAGAVTADFILNTQGPGFPDAVVQTAAQEDGVRSTASVKVDGMQLCDNASCSHAKQVFVTAFPAKAIGDLVSVTTAAGSDDLAPGTILMSENAAKSDKVKPGDTVRVQFARSGVETLTLAGTYETNQLIGDYLVDASKAKDFSTQRDVAGLVGLDKGADAAAVRKALDSSLKEYPNVEVLDQSEFVGQAKTQVNQIVTIINILLGLSVLIALLGVINTLALSVIERTRELGLLRAVGMARKQVKRMIRTESVLICTFGGLLGLVGRLGVRHRAPAGPQGRGRDRAGLPGGHSVRLPAVLGPRRGRSRQPFRPGARRGSTCSRRSRRSRRMDPDPVLGVAPALCSSPSVVPVALPGPYAVVVDRPGPPIVAQLRSVPLPSPSSLLGQP